MNPYSWFTFQLRGERKKTSRRTKDMNRSNPIPPTVAFSLAAVVRVLSEGSPAKLQYVLVHEKPPRGWWLPGGGIEHHDLTPVEAAVRETVEEAAAFDMNNLQNNVKLPKMTHLLSVEQTAGRIRFIFRGEWIDDTGTSLKLPPGDDESIEAKWATLEEIKSLPLYKRGRTSPISTSAGKWDDQWLRGHEPITYYQMLESNWAKGQSIPGLPLLNTNNKNVIGAFFQRRGQRTESCCNRTRITHRGRDAIVTHLQARLIVYDESQQMFAVDKETCKFPSDCVNNQFAQTLRQLVDGMIVDFTPDSGRNIIIQKGTLRVEYTVHENGIEATLIVFPYLIISSPIRVKSTIRWLHADDLDEYLEKLLATALIENIESMSTIDVLAGKE